MYKHAVYYFIALLAVLVIGFWPSYYSRLFDDISFGQHFHGITMTLWVVLLINQAWLMKTGNRKLHKTTGKLAFVLGPLVIVAAFYVAFDFIAKKSMPYSEGILAIHWFGIFLAFLFAWLFAMAIYHRKNPQLHAPYMICTAMVFLIPGLGRALRHVGEFVGFQAPPFPVIMAVPVVIGLIMIWRIPSQRAIGSPVGIFTIAWAANVALFLTLPKFQFWVDFTAWSATLLA